MTIQLPREIQRKLAKLQALENGGVDNWEWYDEALKPYREVEEREEKAEELLDQIAEIFCNGVEEPAGRGAGYGLRDASLNDALKVILENVKEFK